MARARLVLGNPGDRNKSPGVRDEDLEPESNPNLENPDLLTSERSSGAEKIAARGKFNEFFSSELYASFSPRGAFASA